MMLLATFLNGITWVASDGTTAIKCSNEWWRTRIKDVADPKLRAFARMIPALVSDQIIQLTSDGLEIPFASFGALESLEQDPLEACFEWSNLTLDIQSRGTLGLGNFRFEYRFLSSGEKEVFPERHGPILKVASNTYRLPYSQHLALSLMDEFNGASEQDRGATGIYVLQKLKKLLQESNSQLSTYLHRENAIAPESVELRFDDHPTRGLSVYPVFQGVPEDQLKAAFYKSDGTSEVYNVESPDAPGTVIRVVVSPKLKKVLRNAKDLGSRLKDDERLKVLHNPEFLLPGGADHDDDEDSDEPDPTAVSESVTDSAQSENILDLVHFGPRVTGIGIVEKVTPIARASGKKWMDEGTIEGIGLQCRMSDGTTEEIYFDSEEDLNSLLADVRTAQELGRDYVEWKKKSLFADVSLKEHLEGLVAVSRSKGQKDDEAQKEMPPRFALKTLDNLDTLDYKVDESPDVSSLAATFQRPRALNSQVSLKPHQEIGISWLQSVFHHRTWQGVLLADDMGLGKTLQLLSFLAWIIENEPTGLGKKTGPYDPILVVCPPILLDNWQSEIARFFNRDVFEPILVLHDKTLKDHRLAYAPAGFETELGKSFLDIGRIREHRIVLTNYDTVRNYQFSFGMIDWTVVIFDEAQKVKEPTSSITKVARTLKRRFMVNCTGTPVENSLSNLWCLLDILHPSKMFGSLREFQREYGELDGDRIEQSDRLRKLVRFNTTSALVLRRAKKSELTDLPPKTPQIHYADLSDLQRDLYIWTQKNALSSSENKLDHLAALQKLQSICEHPNLISAPALRDDPEDYLKVCPKLSTLLRILEDIRSKNEKALIFARRLDMQAILQHLLENRFKIPIKLINGATSKRQYSRNSRTAIIDEFSAQKGFNLLILAPDVGGVGLNITSANHVIHYGRWWNPAKENQATDRAYRIGQTKEVFVHYLIARDSRQLIPQTFDEKLHELLRSKEELAEDFLYPSEVDYTETLASDILGKPATDNSTNSTSAPLKLSDLEALAPHEFEAAIGALYKPLCSNVILTPKSGDRGVDLILVKENELVFVQCKQRAASAKTFDDSGLLELRDGLEHYKNHILPQELRYKAIKLILFTNGEVSKDVQRKATTVQVEVRGKRELERLLKESPISRTNVLECEHSRCSSLPQIANLLLKPR